MNRSCLERQLNKSRTLYINPGVLDLLDELRKRSWNIATTNGCFDLLHAGHVNFLQSCLSHPVASPRTALVVLVNDDISIKRMKGPGRPVYPEEQRLSMIRALRCVHCAYLFSNPTPVFVLGKIKPDFHFKGEEWSNRDVPEESCVGKMVYLPHSIEGSTTSTIERIRKMEIGT